MNQTPIQPSLSNDEHDPQALRSVIKTTGMFGVSSLSNIGVGIVRAKLCAVLLGPAGIALIGILGTLLQAATLIFGLGLRGGGVREIAASEDAKNRNEVRRTLLVAHLVLGILGALTLWIFGDVVSMHLFDDAGHANLVRWVGLGVLLGLIGAANTALLQGMRDIRRLALCGAVTTLLGSTLAVGSIFLMGMDGIWLFVICIPLMSALVSSVFLVGSNTPPHPIEAPAVIRLQSVLRKLLLLGLVFMIASVLPIAARLWVVSRVYTSDGPMTAGLVQVAWTISIQYVGLVLTSLAADYYPRLSAAPIASLNSIVNQQTRVSLLIGAPLILGMVAMADIVVPILYSHRFVEAAPLVRINLIGDLLKIVSWPFGFLLLSRRHAGTFLMAQLIWFISLCTIFLGLSPRIGASAAPIAYLVACSIGALFNLAVARQRFGVALSRSNARIVLISLTVMLAVFICSASMMILWRVVATLLFLVTSLAFARMLIVDFGGQSRAMQVAKKLLLIGPSP